MIERTTVRLPKDLLLRAKRKALADDRTLTSLIDEGLRLVVNEAQKKPNSKRILPRHSSVSGGPLPDLDISNSAALQEMEYLEYAERLKNGFQ